LDIDSIVLGKILGLRSVCAIGFRGKDDNLSSVIESISAITPSWHIPWLTVDQETTANVIQLLPLHSKRMEFSKKL